MFHVFDKIIHNPVAKSVFSLREIFQPFLDVLDGGVTELLGQVAERGASGSPELNLGQSCWGDPFALELFVNGILDGGGPRLHS